MKIKFLIILLLSAGFAALAVNLYSNSEPKIENSIKNDTVIKRVDSFAAKELISVLKKIKDSKTIDARFKLSLLDGNSGELLESFEGSYLKSNNSIYIKSFLSENLISDDYFLAIDHSDKIIFVEKPEFTKDGAISETPGLFLLDSLVNLSDSMVVYQKLNDKESVLKVQLGYSSYESMDLIYDFKTKELKQLILYPFSDYFNQVEEGEVGNDGVYTDAEINENAKYKIVIDYKKLVLNGIVKSELLDYKNYIKISEKSITTTSKFNDYEIDFE